jgi:hypothetical protein
MIDRPDRPRPFEEVAAAQCAADRDRLELAEHLMDPIREVTIIEDQARNGDWKPPSCSPWLGVLAIGRTRIPLVGQCGSIT